MARKVAASTAVEWSPTQVSWLGANRVVETAESLLEASARLPGRDLIVALSRRTAFIRAYRVPNAGRAEVKRILDVQIGQLFPIAANELSYDFYLTDDVSSEGRLAVLAAMRSADLNSLHEQAKAAGLRLISVIPVAFGSALLARHLGQHDAAVVHRTTEGLAVDIIIGGELRYSRVATMPPTSLGIEAEINRTFAAAVLNPSAIIAAGALAVANAETATETWGIEELLRSPIDLNIQTPAQERLIEKRASMRRVRLSFLLLAAALLLFTGVYLDRMDKQAAVTKSTGTWQRTLNRLRAIRDAETTKGAELSTFRASLDRGFDPAQTFEDMITIASNSTPPGVWLTGIAAERGKVITLRGTAKSGEAVAAYQQGLVSEPRFRDVRLVFANNTLIENTPVVQFSISAIPVGNLPLVEPTKKKGPTKK